jgi:phosphoglycerate dehydrogenase-like enzyme
MLVLFLDPLPPVAQGMPEQFLGGHEVLVGQASGPLPEGWQSAKAIVWSQRALDASTISSMPQLRLLQRIGFYRATGDVSQLASPEVRVSVLPHGTAARVAEHTLALIMGLVRGLVPSHQSVVEGSNPLGYTPEERVGATPTVNWAQVPNLQSLWFKKVGIVGFGEIGSVLAQLLRPFRCDVVYFKRTRLTDAEETGFGVSYSSLDDLLATSDIVCNLLPTNDATRGLLGASKLALMKKTGFFINTGRAATTDEKALIELLRRGKIAGAGLDVFDLEPLPPGHPLVGLPNVLLTPHTAGGTPSGAVNGLAGWTDTFRAIAENLRRVEAGEPLLTMLRTPTAQP